MDLAWIVAPAVLLGGSSLLAIVLRRLMGALDELRGAHERVRRLEEGLIPLRVESRRLAGSVERAWQR